MKTIINKETEVRSEKGLMSRADLLKLVAETATGDKGISVSEMRSRLKIVDAISNMKDDKIILEDTDFELLKSSFNLFPWARPSKDIIELADHLEELSKQK